MQSKEIDKTNPWQLPTGQKRFQYEWTVLILINKTQWVEIIFEVAFIVHLLHQGLSYYGCLAPVEFLDSTVQHPLILALLLHNDVFQP